MYKICLGFSLRFTYFKYIPHLSNSNLLGIYNILGIDQTGFQLIDTKKFATRLFTLFFSRRSYISEFHHVRFFLFVIPLAQYYEPASGSASVHGGRDISRNHRETARALG